MPFLLTVKDGARTTRPHWLFAFPHYIGRILTRFDLVVPLSFLLLIWLYAPIGNMRDFDYDEGINLMKAQLYADGYGLYTDIWSDQPPLMTIALASLIRVSGPSVVAARWFVAVLSALLLWALYSTMRRSVSAPAALGAVFLLVLSEEYIRLTASVMIGLPSLALGVIAAYLLLRDQEQETWRMAAASGVVMALSLQTKLITVVMVPAFLVHMFVGIHTVHTGLLGLRQIAVWIGAMGVTFIAIGIGIGSLDPQTLLVPHFGEQTQGAFLNRDSHGFVLEIARQHLAYLMIAGTGVLWALWRRRVAIVFPAVWLFASVVALLVHRPLWHHHVTLVTIPLSWLCAWGLERWLDTVGICRTSAQKAVGRGGPKKVQRGSIYGHYGKAAATVYLCITIGVFLFYPGPLFRRVREQTYRNRPLYSQAIVAQLQDHAEQQSGWVFTDRPYYAFQAGLSVPPPIAAMSRKRLQSGRITDGMLIDTLRTYRPRYVLLERFMPLYSERLMSEINMRYDLTFHLMIVKAKPGHDPCASS